MGDMSDLIEFIYGECPDDYPDEDYEDFTDDEITCTPTAFIRRRGKCKYAYWLGNILSCPECSSPVARMNGKFGPYVGCSKIDCFWTGKEPPDYRYTQPEDIIYPPELF